MTCIVGIETKDGVWMGGDSAAVGNLDMYRTKLRKVFQNGPFLIGYTSSFRMGQLLQYHLQIGLQQDDQKNIAYLITKFIPAVRECLREGGYMWLENNRETGGSFLVGYRGKIYEVASDFQVNSSQDGFMAIGCGDDYALGSLRTSKYIPTSAEWRLQKALEVAAHFSGGVCAPFYVLGMENVND